jgi:hypothetical protein
VGCDQGPAVEGGFGRAGLGVQVHGGVSGAGPRAPAPPAVRFYAALWER